jgi:hypothetical protein
MHFYKLDSKFEDEKFLNGSSVQCPAIIAEEEFLSGKFKEGERIIVMLSNGKKYMGKIIKFSGSVSKGLAQGHLEMKRNI